MLLGWLASKLSILWKNRKAGCRQQHMLNHGLLEGGVKNCPILHVRLKTMFRQKEVDPHCCAFHTLLYLKTDCHIIIIILIGQQHHYKILSKMH